MVYTQPRIRPGEWDEQTSLVFWRTNGSPNLGQTSRSMVSQHKKNQSNSEHCLSGWPQRKTKGKRKKKKISTWTVLENWKKQTVEHESDGDTNCKWCTRYNHQRIDKRIRGFRNKRMSGTHPSYRIIKIDPNTKKSPGDPRRLVVIQTPVENRQLTFVWYQQLGRECAKIYQQPGARKTRRWSSKIWKWKDHNKKAEWKPSCECSKKALKWTYTPTGSRQHLKR